MTRVKRDAIGYLVVIGTCIFFLTWAIPTYTPEYPGYGAPPALVPNIRPKPTKKKANEPTEKSMKFFIMMLTAFFACVKPASRRAAWRLIFTSVSTLWGVCVPVM